MKKDKEWLKDEVKVFQVGENMFTAEFNAGVQQALEYVQELIDQLDEPEKVVIPQFVAEWFENDKRDMEIEDVFWQIENCEMVKLDVDRWISDNRNTFIRAWLDGYEVEKEKLYTVELPHSYELIKLLHTQTYRIKNYSDSGFGDYTNTFTEAEIKKIDERLMAFAEEVTP